MCNLLHYYTGLRILDLNLEAITPYRIARNTKHSGSIRDHHIIVSRLGMARTLHICNTLQKPKYLRASNLVKILT